MLQQTQVKTVIPYFLKVTKRFKTLRSFSKCTESEILKLWEGLGYYRRARNLLKTSKILTKKYNSRLPKTIEQIKNLPGVGNYTASALLGLVHDKPVIAIDGNVKRVFSRIINRQVNKIDFDKFVEVNNEKLFGSKRNSDLVEGLMEFGALICKPKNPICNGCNLKKNCKYFKSSNKIRNTKIRMIKNKNYDVFCYINKKKQIALKKNNELGFLSKFSLPEIRETKNNNINNSWKFLKSYRNNISNKKLNINLYYKFSDKIPSSFNWYSLEKNEEFIPTFTKKIFRQVSILF